MTVSPRPTARMLDVAERVTTMIEARIWTREKFPSKEEIARRLAVGHTTTKRAFDVLQARGVLVLQADPGTNNRLQRLLPPADGSEIIGRSHERLLTIITERLADGTWTADNFPTIMEMCAEFSCGTNTVSQAVRLAEKQGLLHRVRSYNPSQEKRTAYRYQPVDDFLDIETKLTDRIASDIRRHELIGPLPERAVMCRNYQVGPDVMREAYERLRKRGLIRRVWLPDFSRLVWYPVNARMPSGLIPVRDTKAEAIAGHLAPRLSTWVSRRPDGRIVGRRLPSPETLRKQYHTSWAVMVAALDLLVDRGLLERLGASGKKIADYRPTTKSVFTNHDPHSRIGTSAGAHQPASALDMPDNATGDGHTKLGKLTACDQPRT